MNSKLIRFFALFLLSVSVATFGLPGIELSKNGFAQEADKTSDKSKVAEMSDGEKGDEEAKAKIDTKLFSSLKLRNIGPAFMSGRIGDLAIDQKNPNIWYVAVASGNVFKTTNAGTTFEPIFENYPSYSIGCITVDPNNSNTVWIGTGENNGGRHIGFGDGIYVSHDGGQSFKNTGLKESEHLSKILVDPRDSKVVFAASQGPLWSPGGERGLFKSIDGGSSWENILSAGEYTGVTDVVMDPSNPDVMYAATHQRHRNVWAIVNAGPETAIHKTIDGGKTWTKLSKGLPGGDMGKISLGVSNQKTNVVYATIELPGRVGGFWRSKNHGASWTKTSDFVSGGTGPHYYQELWLDPHRYGVMYQANNSFVRSVDDGETWEVIEGSKKHVDNHAVAFDPNNPDFVLVGCDGGVYSSYDFCKTYRFHGNLPLAQFYKIDVDYDFPFYNVVGGTQDNYSQYGPTRTPRVQGIVNSDWIKTIGGDGHDNAIDPVDPDTMYCESQQGFIRRYDRKTGEAVDVRPRPADGEDDFRFNWDSPILISPHSHTRIYFGSKFLHRSEDRGDSWKTISPDLSRNINRFTLPTMGRVPSIDAAYDLYAMSQYGNITSISESPVVEDLLYVGTDDGLIQVSEDGGENWTKIDQIYGVPEYSFVNDIKADLHDADTVYACLDNHKTGDYRPFVVRSTDRGRTWRPMMGDLPEKHLCWRIIQDHERKDLFFLATEFGIFWTINDGENWTKLKGSPTISFRDLAIQKRENDLVAASFGRGIFVLDDYTPLRHATPDVMKKDGFHIFPIRPAYWYVQSDSLGGRFGFQGDSFFSADNPPHGATFTYYSDKEYKSKAAKRKAAEKKAGDGDVPTPDWDELRAEKDEEPARIYFEISDAEGEVLSRVNGSTGKGVHRATWDFRCNAVASGRFGPLCLPGTYTMQAFEMVNDTPKALGDSVEFEVKSVISPTLPSQDAEKIAAFQKETIMLSNSMNALSSVLQDLASQLDAIESALKSSAAGTPDMLAEASELMKQIDEIELQVSGDEVKADREVQVEPTMNGRLRSAMFGSFSSTYGPTETHREQVEIVKNQFSEVSEKLQSLIDNQLEPFETKLDDAGIPWTPGRKIPSIK